MIKQGQRLISEMYMCIVHVTLLVSLDSMKDGCRTLSDGKLVSLYQHLNCDFQLQETLLLHRALQEYDAPNGWHGGMWRGDARQLHRVPCAFRTRCQGTS